MQALAYDFREVRKRLGSGCVARHMAENVDTYLEMQVEGVDNAGWQSGIVTQKPGDANYGEMSSRISPSSSA